MCIGGEPYYVRICSYKLTVLGIIDLDWTFTNFPMRELSIAIEKYFIKAFQKAR